MNEILKFISDNAIVVIIFTFVLFEGIEGIIRTIKGKGVDLSGLLGEVKEDVIELMENISMFEVERGSYNEDKKKEAIEQLQEIIKKL